MSFEETLQNLKPLAFEGDEDAAHIQTGSDLLVSMYKLAEKVGKTGFRASQTSESISQRFDSLASMIEVQLAAREADLREERRRLGELQDELQGTLRALVEVLDLITAASAVVSRQDSGSTTPEFNRLIQHMLKAAKRCGLERTAHVGEPFDPEFHEAVEQAESTGSRPGSIAEVLRDGYRYQGRVVRIARVTIGA